MNTKRIFSLTRGCPVSIAGAILVQLIGVAAGANAQATTKVQSPAQPPAVVVQVPSVTVQVPRVQLPEVQLPDSDVFAKLELELGQIRPEIAMSIDADAQAELSAQLMAQSKRPAPVVAGRVGSVWIAGTESYDAGLTALDNDEWQQAVEIFNHVIKAGKTRVDGAMYWKAYALDKLGQRKEALSTLQELQKSYPNSRWLSDAQALAIEVKQNAGQAVKPEEHGNEELRLLAINSVMQTDPQRAIPMLQQVLKGSDSPKVKERALFVLAQNSSPAAREVLGQIAAGSNGNPDLQMKAVRYLGIYGRSNPQVLRDIYVGSRDPDVKREVLRTLGVAHDVDQLLNIAKTEPSPELRIEAIRQLGMTRAGIQWVQLYRAQETDDLKQAARLADLARQDDANARTRANGVRTPGTMDNAKTADALVQIYKSDKDEGVKKAVIDALYMQQNAKALVDLARGETNLMLKKEVVSRLATMKSKEATDYMLELLK